MNDGSLPLLGAVLLIATIWFVGVRLRMRARSDDAPTRPVPGDRDRDREASNRPHDET